MTAIVGPSFGPFPSILGRNQDASLFISPAASPGEVLHYRVTAHLAQLLVVIPAWRVEEEETAVESPLSRPAALPAGLALPPGRPHRQLQLHQAAAQLVGEEDLPGAARHHPPPDSEAQSQQHWHKPGHRGPLHCTVLSHFTHPHCIT